MVGVPKSDFACGAGVLAKREQKLVAVKYLD
jgi:hypothetical protein